MQVDFNLYLKQGRENAVHMPTLAKQLGVSERRLRQLVFDAKLSGIIICSDNSGYYFPKNDSEIKDYERRQRKRAFSTLRVSKLRKPANNQQVPGQLSLQDYFADFIE